MSIVLFFFRSEGVYNFCNKPHLYKRLQLLIILIKLLENCNATAGLSILKL